LKSFSPAGMATKALFGYSRDRTTFAAGVGAKTFGNPDGAVSGGGAYGTGGASPNGPKQGGDVPNGGGGHPPAFNWTSRTSPTAPGATIVGAAVSDTGTTLIVDETGKVFRSTDGGVTWSGALVTLAPPVVGGAAFANGVFVIGGGPDGASAGIFRSIDNGSTWSGPLVIGTVSGPLTTVVGHGAGIFLALVGSPSFFAGNKNYSVSSDGGNTWTPGTTFANRGWVAGIWDGTQYVAFGTGTFSAAESTLCISPDGFTWTLTPISPSSSGFDNSLLFGGGVYLAASVDGSGNSTVRSAATAIGLATAPDVLVPPLASGGTSHVLYDGAKYFAFDFSGGVASSPDLVTWTAENLNFSRPGDSTSLALFDPINGLNMAFGNDGSISTRPV
jgi:hypothetical protein